MSPLIQGIDIGGAFTDPIMMHGDGDVAVVKTPSTPRDPRLAVECGISLLAKRLGLRATYDGEVETALNLDSLAQSLHSAGVLA